MRLEKRLIQSGNAQTCPRIGDEVGVLYTGWTVDTSQENMRGKLFDSTDARGLFKTRIGVGQVIRGWDILITQMTLGERAVLIVPTELAYGRKGFPGLIRPGADLIFDVELRSINGREA